MSSPPQPDSLPTPAPEKFPVDLRNIMRYFASAVTVTTGAMDTGELFGLTISAFISVSLDPPLVLVSIRNESTAKDLFIRAKKYCVNILSADQQKIAEKFSLSGEGGRFQNLDYYFGKGGSPIIRGCIGYIDCKLVEAIAAGDHTLMIGEALDVGYEKKDPLLYVDRNYVRIESPKRD